MKFNPHDIFTKYPDIEDIAIRLEQSENEAKDKNKKQNEPVANTEAGGKRFFQYVPEHCVISHFYKEGRWQQTPFTAKPGREVFLKDLAKIIETRKPDAIKIEIYKGKTEKSGVQYSREIFFEQEADKTHTEQHQLGMLEKRFDEKLEKFKTNPDANNLQIEILRKDFEKQLTEQQHKSEIKDLNHQHQVEINGLQIAVQQRDEYIKELEDELDESDGELGSLKAEAQKEKERPFGEIILGRVLMQAGENILKHNPKILKIGLGLSDSEIKEIFKKDTKELGEAKTESDNSSFSENTNDDLSGLEEKHKQGITDLNTFFKQIKVEEFKKTYTINCMLQDSKTGFLNVELADKVLAFINENKPKE
jgi:hypothetical protein